MKRGRRDQLDAILAALMILVLLGIAVLLVWWWWDAFILETIGDPPVGPAPTRR